MNQTEPSGKMQQRESGCFNFGYDGTLRNKGDFALTLTNVNNVNISDLVVFLVILFLSSICSHLKINYGGDILSQ